MKTLIFLFLSITLQAQYFTLEKTSQIVTSSMAGWSGAKTDYYSKLDGIKNNRKFHQWNTSHRVSLVGVGVSMALQEKRSIAKILSSIILSGSIYMTTHTISYNHSRNKPIFWQSDFQKKYKTGGFVENINYKWYPVIMVACFLIDYLVDYFNL